ncbi:MAG TPA: ABC transporter ATP-binding protein [Pseudonocardiaceae bacterium]|nr:ABC transporter ATP-binding protein [Pseudonocardiaceae bacterium]
MLRLVTVSKRYGTGSWVLQDVGLEISAGEVVAIRGANGSGKSTLLKVLAGLSRPTRGTVSRSAAVVGYVPERFPPNERLSAMEYLTHLGRVRGLSTSVATARAGELADRLALVGEHAPLRTLSKGNAQKVALAQALLVPPQLLVLDEPWSGLDVAAHEVVAELIVEVAEAGGTVVFTDHRESITGRHATRTYALSEGCLTVSGVSPRRRGGAAIEVVLIASGGSADDVDWYAMNGVVLVEGHGETITIRIARDHVDALLLAALRRGCSVKEVRPIARESSMIAQRPAP